MRGQIHYIFSILIIEYTKSFDYHINVTNLILKNSLNLTEDYLLKIVRDYDNHDVIDLKRIARNILLK